MRQLKHAMNSVEDEVHRFAAPTQSRTRGGDANSDRNAHDTGRDRGRTKQLVQFRGYSCLKRLVLIAFSPVLCDYHLILSKREATPDKLSDEPAEPQ